MRTTYFKLLIGVVMLFAFGCNNGSTATTKEEADSALIKNSESYVDREKPHNDTVTSKVNKKKDTSTAGKDKQ